MDLFVSKLMEAGGCGGCWTGDHRLAQRVQVAVSCYFCWGGSGGGDVTRVDRVKKRGVCTVQCKLGRKCHHHDCM